MDPINLLVAFNLFASMTANIGGAKKGFKVSVTGVAERPKTFLQKLPPNVSAVVVLLSLLGIFGLGTFQTEGPEEFINIRVIGLVLFIIFSWVQVWVYKSLGKDYSQEIVVLKTHNLHTTGAYKLIRHPQYVCQLLSDLGIGIALMSYLAVPVVVLIEIPLFIMRAAYEDRLLAKHFGEEFSAYKKRSGFMFPFIG